MLYPLIGVVDDTLWPSQVYGHLEGLENQFSTEVGLHGPANHPPAEHVHHYGKVEKSRPCRHIGYVCHPQTVWGLGAELTLHQVWGFSPNPPKEGVGSAS